jgi:hypothetical protein
MLILAGCPTTQRENAIQKTQQNKFNFPDEELRSYKTIEFKLSRFFEDSYYTEYVIKSDAMTKSIPEMNIHFSIEEFDQNDIDTYRFLRDKEGDEIEIVHDFYINSRLRSLTEGRKSIRKKLSSKVGFKGFTQNIDGGLGDDETTWSSYFLASVLIDGKVYIFQMIGRKDVMKNFYDDFLKVIESIEK